MLMLSFLDDNFGIPVGYWDKALELNEGRIPTDYQGGADQWLRDRIHDSFQEVSAAAKASGYAQGRDVKVVNFYGWVDG